MKITKKSTYAIMACAYMAKIPKTLVSSEDVALACGTTTGFMNLIFTDLKNAKIVFSKKGPGGGYRLDKPFTQISILEVLEAMDESLMKSEDYKEIINEGMGSDNVNLLQTIYLELSFNLAKTMGNLKISNMMGK